MRALATVPDAQADGEDVAVWLRSWEWGVRGCSPMVQVRVWGQKLLALIKGL